MDKKIEEDTASVPAFNNVGSGSNAALGVGKEGEPPGKPKKKKTSPAFSTIQKKVDKIMSEDRIDKIDDAISRLAIVASDLSKMLAVHEHRIIQQEKNADNIAASIDKRRTEVDNILKDVYSTIRTETNMLRESSTKQHIEQNVKIEAIQKTMWMAVGAATVVSWAAPILLNKFLH